MILVAIALVCVMGPALAQQTTRLPDTVTPMEYILQLILDPYFSAYKGQCLVSVHINSNDMNQPVTSVYMHLGLNVLLDESSVEIVSVNRSVIPVGKITYDLSNTMIKMTLDDGYQLDVNETYYIIYKFSGALSSETKGLFTGYYENPNSGYVAMNLRPTFARDVFPCFDEPQFKVSITLQVLRPDKYYSVSTAPLQNSSIPDVNNMVLDTFLPTDLISLHSLSLFVSPVAPVNAMGMIVYAPPGTPIDPSYITTILANISTMFGQFPISPLNYVVLPDRVNIAFSTYGAIYSSPEVFANETEPTLKVLSLKLNLAEAFLRQNLEYYITPQWWSDIWLSESIGAYIAVNIQPELWWTTYKDIIIRKEALGDYLGDSCPIVNNGPLIKWDIEAIIANQTVRNKGLSVLTMWEKTLPEGIILETVQEYIKLNKSLVTTSDLMDILYEKIYADGTYNVSAAVPLLHNWVDEKCHPKIAYGVIDSTTFNLTQISSCADAYVGSSPIWPVSISYTSNGTWDWSDTRQGQWLLEQTTNFTVIGNATNNNAVFVFNLESAPVRFDYGQSWVNILGALSYYFPPTPDDYTLDSVRATIQDDAVALSIEGSVQFSIALDVIEKAQRNEMDWYSLAKACESFTNRIGNVKETAYSQFQFFADNLFSAEFLDQLDLTNSSNNPDRHFVRSILTPLLCDFNIGNFRRAAVELSDYLWKGNSSSIASSDKENIACYGARYSSASPLNTLIAKYQNSSSAWERHLYITAIGCLLDSNSVQSILTILLNETSPFTKSDTKAILLRLSSSMQNSDALVDFIVNNPITLQNLLGVGFLSDLINNLAKSRGDLSKLAPLTNATVELVSYLVDTINRAMGKADASEAWWKAHGADLSAALPQVPVTTTMAPTTSAPNATTTTPKPTPSSASSLQVFSLIIAPVVMIIRLSL